MDFNKRKCLTCEYSNPCWSDRLPCLFCDVWRGKYKEWRPKVETSDLIKMCKMKERAEKIYREMLKLYANEPVNTPIRNRAYDAIWISANVLGYKDNKVEKDMHEAEKRK